jgi:hypothetical protein
MYPFSPEAIYSGNLSDISVPKFFNCDSFSTSSPSNNPDVKILPKVVFPFRLHFNHLLPQFQTRIILSNPAIFVLHSNNTLPMVEEHNETLPHSPDSQALVPVALTMLRLSLVAPHAVATGLK